MFHPFVFLFDRNRCNLFLYYFATITTPARAKRYFKANQIIGRILHLTKSALLCLVMRLTAFLLSILVLLLSCLPCADAVACGSAQGESFAHFTSSNQQHTPHSDDCCSPFCQCACCASLAMPQQAAFDFPEAIAIHSDVTFASYLPEPVREMVRPVWQPPRL